MKTEIKEIIMPVLTPQVVLTALEALRIDAQSIIDDCYESGDEVLIAENRVAYKELSEYFACLEQITFAGHLDLPEASDAYRERVKLSIKEVRDDMLAFLAEQGNFIL